MLQSDRCEITGCTQPKRGQLPFFHVYHGWEVGKGLGLTVTSFLNELLFQVCQSEDQYVLHDSSVDMGKHQKW